MSAYKFNLDLHSSQSQVSLAVKQSDTDRSFEITLSDGSEAFILPAYCVVTLLIKKPSGNTYTSGCIIKHNSVIEFQFDENVATDPGINICELAIYGKDNALIASPNFTMIVSDRAVNSDNIEISPEDVNEFNTIYNSEAQRIINEYGEDGTGETSGRVYNENQRIAAENERATAEHARAVAEDERAVAENNRKDAYIAAEATRNENYNWSENQRNSAFDSAQTERETAYNKAEALRDGYYTSAENQRNLSFDDAEAARQTAYEIAQGTREEDFKNSENSRKEEFEAAEATRQQKETARVSAESGRALAELGENLDGKGGRVGAEKKREALYNEILEKKNNGEFDGEDGLTPFIGSNGNWWIGDTDTGVKAQGDKGEGVPSGGTKGQVLAKASNADYDFEWKDDAKGERADAFNYISVEGVTITPDQEKDTLTLNAGRHIRLLGNSYGDSVNISVADVENVYNETERQFDIQLDIGDIKNEVIKFDVLVYPINENYGNRYTKYRASFEVELQTDQLSDSFNEYEYKKIVVKTTANDVEAWFNYQTNQLLLGCPHWRFGTSDSIIVKIDSEYGNIVSFNDLVENKTQVIESFSRVNVERLVTDEYLSTKIQEEQQRVNAAIDEVNANLTADVKSIEKRIANIENHIEEKYYITSAESAFERIIPSNACPYIELNSVGGVYSRASNNLLNPALFNTDVDDRGYAYYPGGAIGISAHITLPAGMYTVSSSDEVGDSLRITNRDESVIFGESVSKLTFTIETEDTIKIHLMGDFAPLEEPFWFGIMLNKGPTEQPFERYYKYAPVVGKNSNNLLNPAGFGRPLTEDGGIVAELPTGEGHYYRANVDLPDYDYYTVSAFDEYGNKLFAYFGDVNGRETLQTSGMEQVFVSGWGKPGTIYVMVNRGQTTLPFEPFSEGKKSTKVTAIEHYGANLVDDVALFKSQGWVKQDNGYYLGSNPTGIIAFENVEGKQGSMSISYMSKTLTANGSDNSVCLALITYSDGNSEYRALTTDTTKEYGLRTYTTPADKTVSMIKLSKGIEGTFEIKDLIINWGGVAPYQPYSAKPIFTLNIPQSIQNLNGDGFGTIDFDNKKYIQKYDENGELSTPIITDISSDLIGFDNTLEVQAGGTFRFINEAKAPILSTISYLAKEGSV